MSENDRPNEINTGGGAFISGNVNTGGGDFAGRDKITIIGDGNVAGDSSQATVIKQANQGATMDDFIRLLAEMRALLPQAGLGADMVEAVDADVKVVEQQAGKSKPSVALITTKLESITKLLAAAAGTAAAADKLLPMAQQAAAWASQLFH